MFTKTYAGWSLVNQLVLASGLKVVYDFGSIKVLSCIV